MRKWIIGKPIKLELESWLCHFHNSSGPQDRRGDQWHWHLSFLPSWAWCLALRYCQWYCWCRSKLIHCSCWSLLQGKRENVPLPLGDLQLLKFLYGMQHNHHMHPTPTCTTWPLNNSVKQDCQIHFIHWVESYLCCLLRAKTEVIKQEVMSSSRSWPEISTFFPSQKPISC